MALLFAAGLEGVYEYFRALCLFPYIVIVCVETWHIRDKGA